MKQAIVNGKAISPEAVGFELDRLVHFYRSHGMTTEEIKRNLPTLQEKAQEQAIGAHLLMERAFQLDLPISASDIDAEVAKVIEQVGGEENFHKALAAQKLEEAKFRKELEKGVRVNMLVNQACSHVPEPTEAEVEAFYEAHKKEFVAEHQVHCQHILIKDGEQKLRDIRAKILAGEADFASEAKTHSECPSGAQGGSLGWFGRGMMVPEFDKVAFSMKKGEISDPVKTQFGWHIIYKADERGGESQTLIDVANQIKDLLRHNARGRAIDAFVAELREKASIEYK